MITVTVLIPASENETILMENDFQIYTFGYLLTDVLTLPKVSNVYTTPEEINHPLTAHSTTYYPSPVIF